MYSRCCHLCLVAFTLAQSRAAIFAGALVLGLVYGTRLVKARRFLVAGAVAVAVLLLGGAGWYAMRASHATAREALAIRFQMAQVAVRITRDHPLAGVGLGHYVGVSRTYISRRYPDLFQFAAKGENAHDNFLQMLAEFGIPGLIAFFWLAVPIAMRSFRGADMNDAASVQAKALGAGVAAFLVSAIFGHPLLIPEVLAAFLLALGMAAGLSDVAPRSFGWTRIPLWIGIAVLLVTLPSRVLDALVPPGSVIGVGPPAGTLDGVPFSAAAPRSVWPIAVRARET